MKIFKNYISYLVLPAFILLGISSCKKSDEPFLGSETIAASPNFMITPGSFCAVRVLPTVATTCPAQPVTASFGTASSQKYYFHCQFNERVTWTINIKGQGSGAVKQFTGTSSSLDFGNTLTIWDGSSSSFRFFQKGETCKVVISFLGSNQKDSLLFNIANSNVGPIQYARGTTALLENFDGSYTGTSMAYPYTDLGDGEANSIYLSRASSTVTPVDGIFMLRLTGQDLNGNNYLGGTGPELLTSHASAFEKIIPLCETDPSQLYFNLYIYGTGEVNSNLQIRTYELDTLNPCITRSYNPYPYTYNIAAQSTNDQWASDIYVTWTGWKLVSIPYSAFKSSTNPAAGGNGNRIKQPRNITSIGFLLQSLPNAFGKVDMYVDFITVTWGAPFKQ